MKTNKTPIQELIDYFNEQKEMAHYAMISETFKSVIEELEEAKQKEKQFAFDCFRAGKVFGLNTFSTIKWGDEPTEPDFEKWYKQFEQ